MISIVASSLQLSGALILLLYAFGSIRERVFASLFSTISFVRRDEDGKVKIPKNKLIKAAKQLYMNRVSFIYISMGFMLEIFVSPNPEIPVLSKLSFSIICCVVLFALGFLVSCLLAHFYFPDDIIGTYEGLKEETQGSINTCISINELDDLLHS